MTTFTSAEQLQLEQINRARLDPLSEAAHDTITLNQFIDAAKSGVISADPKQPLAGNSKLEAVAQAHSTQIINSGILKTSSFDPHNGAGDGTPTQRISMGGYTETVTSFHPENFDYQATTFALDEAKLQSINVAAHDQLFKDDPAVMFGNETGGHRLAMLDPNIKEAGVGESTGQFIPGGQTQVMNAIVITENFGTSGPNSFLTGAVYNDTKIVDHFYSLNEGVQSVTATVRDAAGNVVGSDLTGTGGGWSVAEKGAGNYKVTFSGGGLAAPVSAIVEAGTLNAKIDLVNGKEIDSSVNVTLSDGAADLRLIGIANINGTGNAGNNVITGNAGNNFLTGGGGNDQLDGGAGDDTAVLSGLRSDYQVTVLSTTSAKLTDLRGGTPDGTDTIVNIEHVKFADQTVNFTDLKTTTVPVAPAGAVSITNMTVAEGNSGTQLVTFTVTRSGGSAAFDVKFATKDGTATVADGDYVANANTLHFDTNVMKQTFTVTVNGDTKFEGNESFGVTLSAPTNGATIAQGTATGTITNDDVAPNSVPVVTAHNVTVAAKGAIAASSMFAAHDADGDGTITQYGFWDAGNGGGHFTVNGVTQASGAWVIVNAADLATVKYAGAPSGGSEQLFVSAFDGKAWAPNASLTATTLAHAAEDFNNDGASDVLFVNKTGSVAMWEMNGSQLLLNKTFGSIATTWHADATEDFNGDGKADILWHNDDGRIALWQQDGTTITVNKVVGSVGTNWHVAGADDFNGDGMADILFVSDTGQVAEWQMNGATVALNQAVGTLAAGWHVRGTADFNGDGKADILLQNDAGSVAMWQMNGNQITLNQTFGSIGTAWHFAGADDFNGDGKADILWQNDNGQVALWQMNGTAITANTVVGTLPAGSKVVDVGDYNHDGHADILIQNQAGAVTEWQMDGAHLVASQSVGSMTTDWHLV